MKKIPYSPESLKSLRESKGWTQGRLAIKAKWSLRIIIKYELNTAVPSEEALINLGKALGVFFYADWQNRILPIRRKPGRRKKEDVK